MVSHSVKVSRSIETSNYKRIKIIEFGIASFSTCYPRNQNWPKKNINTRRDRKLKIMLTAKRPSREVLYSSDFVDGLSQARFQIEHDFNMDDN